MLLCGKKWRACQNISFTNLYMSSEELSGPFIWGYTADNQLVKVEKGDGIHSLNCIYQVVNVPRFKTITIRSKPSIKVVVKQSNRILACGDKTIDTELITDNYQIQRYTLATKYTIHKQEFPVSNTQSANKNSQSLRSTSTAYSRLIGGKKSSAKATKPTATKKPSAPAKLTATKKPSR